MKKSSKKREGGSLQGFLREARMKAGLSQGFVSKALGYSSPQFVSNWERGLSEPPIETLRVLSELYEIPEDRMFKVVLESAIQKATNDLKTKFNDR